jgi:hypothetical protein
LIERENIMNKANLDMAITKARDLFNNDTLPVIDENGNYAETFIALGLLLDQRDAIIVDTH